MLKTTEHRILKGHDPALSLEGSDIEGVDFLLQEWESEDGTVRELAVRPGLDRTHLTWGPPTLMIPVTS